MKRTVLSVAVGLAMLGSMPFASVARGAAAPLPLAVETGERTVGGVREKIDPNLRGKTGIVQVIVELSDAPTVQVRADGASRGLGSTALAAAQTRQLSMIEGKQQTLARSLSGLQASEIFRVQRVLNGVAVSVDAKNLAAIAQLPGVKAVHPLATYQRDNASSVPLIGAPQVWGGIGGGATGTGLKIGIIDTGIDYTHVGFNGTGNYAAAAADTTIIEPGTFPTAKVVGGIDLVGDDYDPGGKGAQLVPQPDPDPLDCVYTEPASGHGTHVAGTAAGVGVKAGGTAYTGPYNNSIDFSTFKIGPGVAPEASLVAIRVFGCDGSTNVVVEALDYAVDPNGDGNTTDHLDVVNMSLGSDFGSESDADVIASDNATAAGVAVVVSAGNSSDTNYISGSPGSAGSVITVASSVDATDIVDGFRVNSPAAIDGIYPASFSGNYNWDSPPITNTVPVTANAYYPASNQTGCVAWSDAEKAKIAGSIVLVDWRPAGAVDFPCGSAVRANNAAAAGAKGIIMADNVPSFETAIAGNALIPAVFTISTVGAALKSQLTAGTPSSVSVTLSNEFRNASEVTDAEKVDTLSSFSSRGPRRDGVLKPDIAAPGDGIFSVASGTNTEGHTLSGTSMAAPHIAGVMALLKQLHPTWTVQELKALAMNTATTDVRSDTDDIAPIYGPSRVGGGRVDVPNAALGNILAYDKTSPSQVSVSFGTLEVTTTKSLSKQVTVSNKSSTPATYALAYSPTSSIPGVTYTISPQTVTVAAGGTADVTITLNADASKMQHTADPTLAVVQAGDTRHWLSEAQGYLVLFEGSATSVPMQSYLNSGFEVPAAQSDVYAYADVTLTLGSPNSALNYEITFSEPFTATMGHIHLGAAGASGPVLIPLPALPANKTSLTGSVNLTAPQVADLIKGNLYFNFHTPAYPSGEIRGQIVPQNPALRLPIYASARPASEMSASAAKLALESLTTATQETNITLAGRGVNTGANTPLDILSVVSAFELQHTSPAIIDSGLIISNLDLQYVGVTSTMTPTSVVTESTVYFALSTYTNWSTPNEADLNIVIDSDEDGVYDYQLYNSSPLNGTDSTDVFYVTLCDFTGPKAVCGPIDYLNFVGADLLDTVPFNTNVMVMGVPAEAIGLSGTNTRFDYFAITSDYLRSGSLIDETPVLHYDVAAPGTRFGAGLAGLPVYADQPGATIPVSYSKANVFNNATKGVLLIHHHNVSGKKAEVVRLPSSFALPTIFVAGR